MATNKDNGDKELQRKSNKAGILSRSKFYILEYIGLALSLFVLGGMLLAATFSLADIWANGSSNLDLDWMAWIFGVVGVFGSMATVFYARTSGEEIRNPRLTEMAARKVFYYIVLSLGLVSLLVLVITFVFSGSRILFGAGEFKSFLSVTLPAFFAAWINTYFIGFILKSRPVPDRTRKLNVAFIAGISFLIMLAVVATTFTVGNAKRHDKAIESDLRGAAQEVEKYSRQNGKLPESVSDLSLSDGIKSKFSSGKYTYEAGYDAMSEDNPNYRSSSYSRATYKLCASFRGDSANYGGYSYYGFSSHPKGYYCFTEHVYLD